MGATFYRFVRITLKTVYWLQGGVELHGTENVPPAGGCILACNHASFLDPTLVGTYAPRMIGFMARKTLFDNWLLGTSIGALNAFPLDREGDPREALRTFEARLNEGWPVMMFPEGTRSRDGHLQPLQPGVGLIAVRANTPVVPVYLWGTFQGWPRHHKLPRPHHIKILFGEPIVPAPDLDRKGKKAEQARIVTDLAVALHRLEAQAWEGEGPMPPKAPDDGTADP